MTGQSCANGREQGAAVVWDAGAGTGTYCLTCGISLDNPPRPRREWPMTLAVVLLAALLACGYIGKVFALW